MANWNESYRPQTITPYASQLRRRTLITPFENGAEQRRLKWTKEKHRFSCFFNALAKSTFYDIQKFFKARSGAYDNFNFPNYSQYIEGTRLTIDVSADTIVDSSSDFINYGFDADYGICIANSVESNDGYYSLDEVDTGTLSITGDINGNNEALNAVLRIYKVYNVRFLEETFRGVQIAPGYHQLSFDIIEVF